MIRACLRAAIQGEVNPANLTNVGLSLSGGTDSLCLLFTLLEFNLRIHAYIYTVKGFESDDLKRSRRVTDFYHTPLTIAEIPDDLETIVADLRTLMAFGIEGKVRLRCMHGHMHLAPLVEEMVIFNGSGVDGLYGSYSEFFMDRGATTNKAIFDAKRQKHLDNPNDDAMLDQRDCYGRYGVSVLYPYRHPSVVSYLMSKDFATLMKPRRKADTVRDYPEYKQFKGIYNSRGSQQVQAGTRALHDRVLLPSRFNLGHKRVDEVYKDIAKGLV